MTFVNRNLEPYRGFHSFLRAARLILERRPNAVILVVGGDEVSYGPKPPNGETWRGLYLREVFPDGPPANLKFVGKLPYPVFVNLLQASAAHVYLTYPFVLSWSMLEAMSAGALVIGSATAPVTEVIADGENGLLVDFFSPSDIAAKVCAALETPETFQDLRAAARAFIRDRYDLRKVCLPRHRAMIEDLTGQNLPADP